MEQVYEEQAHSPNTIFATDTGFCLWEEGECDKALPFYEYAARRMERHGLAREGFYLMSNNGGDASTGVCMIVLAALLGSEEALDFLGIEEINNVLEHISHRTRDHFSRKPESHDTHFSKDAQLKHIRNKREKAALVALMDRVLLKHQIDEMKI